MSAPRPLNDQEVLSEMNKMVSFISQEAKEKARELQVKADEEFAIEKAKIVRQESLAIDALYEKKRKQAEVGQKIAQSTALNTSRLKILRAREQFLSDLFEDARGKITDLANDEGKYAQLMENLILQGLLLVLSPSCTLVVRAKDREMAKKAAEAASKQYTEISGRTTEVNVDEDEELPTESAGGVKLNGAGNRIMVNNTVDERLALLEDKMLPEIRADLFGLNENRKFYT
ncbi:Vacuolar H-ATPase V1 sector, subunit E [Phaffia rhodozyma]|uniref:Vacuolar H-ATPase V1 sector, subunit E n=1 Tax=Phaffia rhodozyma TaxID=264483 RepID=A0A0F7STI7_PHARH|nr:Vacuolar H-ATPase V1 sector, subunit E [Phaffia rhodozyma]